MGTVAVAVSRIFDVRRLVGARARVLSLVPMGVAVVLFELAIGDGGRRAMTLAVAQVAIFFTLIVLLIAGAIRRTAATNPLAGIVAVAAFASLWSMRPEASIRELLLWLMYTGIAVIVASAVTGTAAMRKFLDALVVIAGWLCLIALFMFWGAGNPGMRWYSTFYWPNPFAALLLLVLPVTLMCFLHAPRIRDTLVHGLMAVLLIVALVFTYSRGAWIALGAVTVLGAVLLRSVRWASAFWRVTVLIALTAVSVFALAQGVAVPDAARGIAARAASVANPGDYAIQGRLNFWRAGLEIFRDHPLFGTGPGTFGVVHPAYQRDARYYARDAHSLYIQAAAEMGAAGLTAIVVLLVSVGKMWRRALGVARGREEYPLISGLGLGLVAFFLHSALDMDWMFPADPALAFALVGLLAGYERSHRVSGTGPELGVQAGGHAGWTRRDGWSRAVILLVLVIALAATSILWVAQRQFMLGQEGARRGQWSLAADHYATAVRWNPLSASYLDAYATALVRVPERRHPRAVDALRRAMTVDRMNAALPLHLAAVVMSGESTPAAQRDAEQLLVRALELDRHNRPDAYRTLARLYREQGRFAEAERVYREAMGLYAGRDLGQGSELYLLLWPEVVGLFEDAATWNVAQGNLEQAAQILEQLVAEDPTTVGAVLQLSDLYVRMNRYADARALLEATARRLPNDPAILEALNTLR